MSNTNNYDAIKRIPIRELTDEQIRLAIYDAPDSMVNFLRNLLIARHFAK